MQDLQEAHNRLINNINSFIRTLKIYPKLLRTEEHQYFHSFFDKTLFITLNQFDLAIGIKYLSLSIRDNNEIDSNYFSRILVVTCHEILNDSHKMFGMENRNKILEKFGQEILVELDKASKNMSILKKENLRNLKHLRNNVIGHKLENASEQAETIAAIKPDEIALIASNIFAVQMKFIVEVTNIITKYKNSA